MPTIISSCKGSLLGLACGDALGTTLEFLPRDTYEPLTDMVGGGPFNLKPGQWTDDTAMMIALAESIIETNNPFNLEDQLNKYVDWYLNGTYSSTGECFDIGRTTEDALLSFISSGGNKLIADTTEYSAGNGSLMRIAPAAWFSGNLVTVGIAATSASISTHSDKRCVQACMFMANTLALIPDKKPVIDNSGGKYDKVDFLKYALLDSGMTNKELRERLIDTDFWKKDRKDIRGSGYVVDSLEAALWCFVNGETFEESVLLAANLGDDADTTAAICGQLAGAWYGVEGIPEKWLSILHGRTEIEKLAISLLEMREWR